MLVLLHGLLVDWLVVEVGKRWSDIVSLSHFEVLSEVLVSAPPVGMDHGNSLVSSDLMEITISNVVLLSVDWESSIGVWSIIELIVFTNMPSPLVHHIFFLHFGQEV